jgi:glycosyltransferase involved in cell wall biosynthesis
MRILYDHQIFSYQKYGGVSKYFYELLTNLPSEDWETTILFSNNEYIKNIHKFKPIHILSNHWFRGQGRIMNELNKSYSIFRIIRGDYDVFHQTHYETYCLKALSKKPMVTTFHDMNFATYNKNEYMVSLQKKSINRANKIIAVSENTRKDLIEMWNINPQKIKLIYHGVDKPIDDLKIGERIIEYPYILYVGRREGFKNFDRFAKSFSFLKKEYSFIKLVCTSESFTLNEKNFFKELKILDSIIHIKTTEIEMANLYKYAEVFVYPSIYEGFGMPILEAMSYGCPVAISKASCFPEIAADAGIYFDPMNIDSIYDSVRKIIDNRQLRDEYIKKGNARYKFFTWEKTAREHMELYKSLF